jgi:MoxR-like ATPase
MGRGYVSPDDFQDLAVPVLAHRIQLAPEARYAGKTAAAILAELVAEVELPL